MIEHSPQIWLDAPTPQIWLDAPTHMIRHSHHMIDDRTLPPHRYDRALSPYLRTVPPRRYDRTLPAHSYDRTLSPNDGLLPTPQIWSNAPTYSHAEKLWKEKSKSYKQSNVFTNSCKLQVTFEHWNFLIDHPWLVHFEFVVCWMKFGTPLLTRIFWSGFKKPSWHERNISDP